MSSAEALMLMLLALAYAYPGNSDMYTFTSGTSLLSETSNSSNTLKMNWLIVGKTDKVKSTPISVSKTCPPGVLGTVFITL